ncbi:MAG: hypothetical protein LBS50_11645 [Prevotellaceae bacterium]|jgi:hypothetical protein|nr:hypothetical protein [Prevotellaceae bacterium]
MAKIYKAEDLIKPLTPEQKRIVAQNRKKLGTLKGQIIEKFEFWEIKTATPVRTAFFKNKLLVWTKGAHPLK